MSSDSHFVKMLSLFTILWASALEWNVEIAEVGKAQREECWPRRRVLAGSSQAWLKSRVTWRLYPLSPDGEVLTVMDGPS